MPNSGTHSTCCILGAGAIGCYIGGLLARAGHAVELLGRPRYGEIIRQQGLSVAPLGAAAEQVAPALAHYHIDPGTHVRCLREASLILVCVKSGATLEAARLIAGYAPATAVVISLQNGLHNTQILRTHTPHRVLAGMVPFNVEHTAPGTFRQLTGGHLYIEHPHDPDCASRIKPLLNTPGLPVTLEHDIEAVQRSKLILNLNNAVNALSGQPLQDMLLDPDYRRVLAAAQSEALRVFRHQGLKLARLDRLYPPLLPYLLRLPTPLFRTLARSTLAIDAQARSSMQADLRAGRLTEVDTLNGEIVRQASQSGLSAPVNAELVRRVHAAEKAERLTWMSGPALRQAVGL